MMKKLAKFLGWCNDDERKEFLEPFERSAKKLRVERIEKIQEGLRRNEAVIEVERIEAELNK